MIARSIADVCRRKEERCGREQGGDSGNIGPDLVAKSATDGIPSCRH